MCFSKINGKKYGLLAITIKSNAITYFKMLLEKEATIKNTCNAKSPLQDAVKYGKLDMLKLLVEKGTNHKVGTYKRRSAEDYAQKYEHAEILTYLKALKP